MSNRITIIKKQPYIRDTGIAVTDVLDRLGEGMSQEQIMAELPLLENEDFPALYKFAADSLIDNGFMETLNDIRGQHKRRLT